MHRTDAFYPLTPRQQAKRASVRRAGKLQRLLLFSVDVLVTSTQVLGAGVAWMAKKLWAGLRAACRPLRRGLRKLMDRLTRERHEPPPRNSVEWMWRKTRRLIVLVIGGTTVALGFVMILTPGPAVVVIPLGLAILASEFVWAKRLLRRFDERVSRRRRRREGKPPTPRQTPRFLPPSSYDQD